MRILIIGAGIGGMTLTALLQQRGVRPLVIEREASIEQLGYMLGLYPLGSRVLHGLGLFEQFTEISVPLRYYQVGNSKGDIIHRYEMDFMDYRFDLIRQCTRPELVSVLRQGVDESALRTNTTVEDLEARGDEVIATFSDGSSDAFDLVVGADGIHSSVRTLLFGKVRYRDTGWGGWVWWAPTEVAPLDTVSEYWGAGSFLGVYPSKQRIGLFGGGLHPGSRREPASGRRASLRRRLAPLLGRQRQLMDTIPEDEAPLFYWRLADARARLWSLGRVALLGDAACAFLPTAGVGASMAMESAAVLNDELSRTNARYVRTAIDFFVRRRRRRVLQVQKDSRKLARWMFVKSVPVSLARNLLMRFYSLRMLAGDTMRSFDEPI